MEVKIYQSPEELGQAAASYCASVLNQTIDEQGYARLLLSTGASQFDTLRYLVTSDVDWGRVEAFHLDEYIGISSAHKASFRKYLRERFVDFIPLGRMHFVETEGDIADHLRLLSDEVTKLPIDVALIGIGENSHIAFNDPPADFDTKAPYIIVNLDEACKHQQVREGWFNTVDEVPKQAITMSVHQIMQSKEIVSCVPYRVKAKAIKQVLENSVTEQIPATILKEHPRFTLYLDGDSSSELDLMR